MAFQDYESDFQECTDSETSPISERSDNSDSSSHLEPIELQTRKKVAIICLIFLVSGGKINFRVFNESVYVVEEHSELHGARKSRRGTHAGLGALRSRGGEEEGGAGGIYVYKSVEHTAVARAERAGRQNV